ncbi:hypothetical protein AB0G02_36385 [Actinosynnema sp. NPDC023658]|uniref:hypothetical protein n=1 Tax=Actinosynnema sp. NPDC023658 TaxID=3155465 RepID=UPI0033C397A6
MMVQVSPSHHEVVGAFIVRARRIQAHSLVRDLTVLSDLARERFDVHLSPDGTSRIRHRLPPDEEVFESLAARVRPLLLDKESVYHFKVTKALKRLLDTSPAPDVEQYRDESNELREAWKTATTAETYGLVQWRGTEVPDTLTPVSNVLLAEAWMYIDLVHVDPDQRRRDALDYPMRQRYLAAVRYYCRIAELVVRTLRYVEKLRDAGVVVLDAADWERDVVVGPEIIEEGIIRVAPAGTEATAADFAEQPGGTWRDLTAVEALRQGSATRLRVVLSHADGTPVAAYDAAIVPRPADAEDRQGADALIAGGVVCRLRFPVADGQPGPPSMKLVSATDSNTAHLALCRFQMQAGEAHTLAFYGEHDDEPHLTFTTTDLTAEETEQLRVVIDTLEDVLAIGALTGRSLGRPTTIGDQERILLRVARRLHEGRVVELARSIGPRIDPRGELPSDEHAVLIRNEPQTMTLAGVEIPMPAFVVWHPRASTRDLGPAAEHGPEAQRFDIAAPQGERFLAWAPDICMIPSDEITQHVQPWELFGIDQQTSPL